MKKSFFMVDVPGLIEGAHEGAGLGDQFLKHVERTRALVHLLDGAKPLDEMLADKATIERELARVESEAHRKAYAARRKQARFAGRARTFARIAERNFPTRAASAPQRTKACATSFTRCGRRSSRRRCRKSLRRRLRTSNSSRTTRSPSNAQRDGTFVITGERVERLAAMTNFDSDEALARFERVLAKMGVEKKLRALGAAEGDTVRIGQYEFTYS